MSFHYVYIKNTVTCTFMLTFMYVIIWRIFYRLLSGSWCWLLPRPLSQYTDVFKSFALSNVYLWLYWVHHRGKITSCRNLASTFTLSLRLKTISVFSKTQKITKSRKWNKEVMSRSSRCGTLGQESNYSSLSLWGGADSTPSPAWWIKGSGFATPAL